MYPHSRFRSGGTSTKTTPLETTLLPTPENCSSKTKGPGEKGGPRNHPEISSQKLADFECRFPYDSYGRDRAPFFGESKLQSRFFPDFFDFQIFSWKGRSIATRAQCDLVEQVLCKTGLHNKDKFLEVVHFVATYQRTTGHLPKHWG